MSIFQFELYVSYSQLCVFSKGMETPFNDWSDRNISQGFSWRSSSVSFMTILDEGKCEVKMFVDEPITDLGVDVVRAFRVPFSTSNGGVEIASISDGVPIELSPGSYALQVEFLKTDHETQYANIRLNKGPGNFEVIRADAGIEPAGELDISGAPAI
ncbi:competence protein ComJ [Stenotrophomonas sp.]|uniref:competence protein ComJ n=1 Tax=Stenotrophomonas sp. TaxID=69392 RepID=UPI0028991856|nr:competence protein ComJ [Stenotrophomonas sp.]